MCSKRLQLKPSLSQQSTCFWGWLSVDFKRALLLRCLWKLKPGEEFSKVLLAEASALTFAGMRFCSLPAQHLCLPLRTLLICWPRDRAVTVPAWAGGVCAREVLWYVTQPWHFCHSLPFPAHARPRITLSSLLEHRGDRNQISDSISFQAPA